MSALAGFSIPLLTSPYRVDQQAIAIQCDGTTRTYHELETASNRIATGLRAIGVEHDQRIGFVGRNGIECVEVLLGASKAGAVPTFFNWRLHPDDFAPVLEDCAAPIVFVDASFAKTFADAAARLDPMPHIIQFNSGGDSDAYTEWRDRFEPEVAQGQDRICDTAVQLYTSGTTGRPKGAMLTRAGFAAAIPDTAEFWAIRPDSVVLSVLPMFHIAGIGTVLGTLWRGGKLVINNDARAETTLTDIASHGVTHLVLASVMLQALVSTPAYATTDVSTLQTVSYGAAPISRHVLIQVVERMKCRIMQPYGLTETTGVLTLLDAADHRRFGADPTETHRLDSCGRARPGVELRIVDPNTGVELAQGEIGEVWARSERIMSGYSNLPNESAEILLPDGWFRTGDIASLDEDGYVTLRDRLKDVIISGGENIYPVEVENVMLSHPDVAEVAVVGLPHEKWGETPIAVVVPASNPTPDPTALIEFSRSKLAHYKCPSEIHFVQELPRNATGKVLRKQLRKDSSWQR